MFTVRHKTIHGQEVVFQAAYVIASPTYGARPSKNGDIVALEFYDATHNQAHEAIIYGKVYVMNDNGRTVADYNLGGWDLAQA